MLVNLIVLTVMGKLPPEGIFNTIGAISAWTFLIQFAILPVITMLEKKK